MVKHVSLAVTFAVSAILLVACAGVADLDVKYTGAEVDGGGPTTTNTSTSSSGSLTNDAGVPIAIYKDAAGAVDPSTLGQPGAACPCDETQGLGCCAGATDSTGSTCVAEQTACQGAFLRCFGPDLEGSVCCAHRAGSSVHTALAGDCKGGASIVCTVDAECPNGTCTIGTCGEVTIGTCDGTPVCP